MGGKMTHYKPPTVVSHTGIKVTICIQRVKHVYKKVKKKKKYNSSASYKSLKMIVDHPKQLLWAESKASGIPKQNI